MMDRWWPREWLGSRHQLWWSLQLEQSPQLELWALMVQECQAEVVVEVPDAVESDEGQQYAGPAKHVCRPSTGIKHCVQWSMSGINVPWHETLWEYRPTMLAQPVLALEMLAWVGLLQVMNNLPTMSIGRE